MKKIIMYVVIFTIILLIILFLINIFIVYKTNKNVILFNEAKDLGDIDCILVLGAGIKQGKPSDMLEDRLIQAINLYKNGISKKIIMSGDHGSQNYDEVNLMKKYAIDQGVPSEDIFMDHAGFSTYESMYRAKEVFKVNTVIVVTQKYHQYRAIYIAKELGLDAYGVSSDLRKYQKQTYREIREIAAREKDFFKCFFKPSPTYLGEEIPVTGNGDITNDKEEI